MTPTLPDALARVERWAAENPLMARDIGVHALLIALPSARVLAELDRLPRLLEALPTVAQLKCVEWAGDALCEADVVCPACYANQPAEEPHAADCWIARLTAALETE